VNHIVRASIHNWKLSTRPIILPHIITIFVAFTF